MKVVIVTGGFDPLHSGHIEYFKAARALGNRLVVGLNSDEWLTRKKGRPFMPWDERAAIIKNLKMVDEVIAFNDDDGTSCNAIYKMLSKHDETTTIIFANGGDRNNNTTPEYEMYKYKYGLEFVFGVGGEDKKNSSSWILNEWKAPKTERDWGYYRVLHEDGKETKVKELVVNPNSELSLQRHKYRSEHWIVTNGSAAVLHGWDPKYTTKKYLSKHMEIDIPVGCWHKLINETNQELKIVEIQHGLSCVEEDIERF